MRIKTLVEYPKLGSGSTFAEFKIFLLKDMDVLVPPRNVQNQFADFVASVDKSKIIQSLLICSYDKKCNIICKYIKIHTIKATFCKIKQQIA